MGSITKRELLQRTGGASLDILRFFAAFFIMVFHCFDDISSKTQIFEPLMKQGWLATNMFLIISGLVMSRAYANAISADLISIQDFFLKRYFRLFPSHAVVLIVLGIIITGVTLNGYKMHEPWAYNCIDWIKQLTLSHAWGLKINTWNYPTWTISTLILCYVLFYLTIKLICNLQKLMVLFLAIIILSIANFIAHFVFNGRLVDIQSYPLLRALTFFMLGVFSEILTRDLKINKSQYVFGMEVVSAAIILFIYYRGDYINPSIIVKDNIIILLICIIVAISSRVNFRETQVTQELGKTSYSLYLVHAPIQIICFEILDNIKGNANYYEYIFWGAIAIMIIGSTALAFLFERYVNKPLAQITTKILQSNPKIQIIN